MACDFKLEELPNGDFVCKSQTFRGQKLSLVLTGSMADPIFTPGGMPIFRRLCEDEGLTIVEPCAG